ncbi:MAG: hypothetical protein U5L76_01920 [Patescibacteria group bacterium]|nr:hypothetical protein [Patescibacteria group bacterium]
MKKILATLLISFFIIPLSSLAYSFNKNRIISDDDLTGLNMSQSRIQEFLAQKGGYLGSYSLNVNGLMKTAARIIYEVAAEFSISPRYLLTTLQKEQSLITMASPSQTRLDWAMGYGVCDGCTYNDPGIQQYKGFYNQVYNAAKRIRSQAYLGGLESGGTTISGWAPGITKTVDCSRGCGRAQGDYIYVPVTPENNATAVLYTYTPHVDGNYSFWQIWSRWFLKHYPNGSLVRVKGEPGIWLIRNNKRYNFVSKSAFIFSYDIDKVVEVSLNEIQAYEYGAPIKFAEYSLLQAPHGGVYILINGQKRAITSKEVFQTLGYSPEELIKVEWSELEAYEEGAKITLDQAYPTGVLLQSRQTGGIYYIENGVKYPIHSPEILESRFPRRRWTQADQSEIDSYPKGRDVKFRDGELIASPNSNGIYLVADGQKRPIPSYEIFQAMGYKWSNIIWTTDRAVQVHPTGEAIDYISA